MSFIDIIVAFFKGLTDGFDGLFSKAENRFDKMLHSFEKKLEFKFRKIKKRLYSAVFELLFWVLSFILILAAGILFFSRFFSLDVIFLFAGVLCLYIAMLFRISR